MSVVVPGKSMSEIGKIIRETDEELTLDLSDKHLRMARGNVTFVCRLLEGDFINYESVIPTETTTETVVDTALLIDSIERASVVINEKMRSPIILRFEETGIGVSCVSSLGKVLDRVHAVTKGPELELGVNNRYILDALKGLRDAGSARLHAVEPFAYDDSAAGGQRLPVHRCAHALQDRVKDA